MEKGILAFALMCLCSVAFADSDSTGIITGTTERLEFSFTNSTGFLDSRANCTLNIYSSANTLVISVAKMSSYGDGRFYYDWAQSVDSGYYPAYVNCTNYAKENATLGGGFFVVPRTFEKAVAHGQVTYVDRYESQAVKEEQQNQAVLMLALGFLVGIGLSLGGYSIMSKK
jgi:hypothetical protein